MNLFLETLVCSLILTRLDNCNSLLYGAPVSSIQILQRMQNNAAGIFLQTPRRSHALPLLCQLYQLPVHHRIDYNLAAMTYKMRSTTVPTCLSRHIKLRQSAWTLRSSDVPLITNPFMLRDGLHHLSGT